MNKKIHFSRLFLIDLEKIGDYIAEQLSNKAALKVTDEILVSLNILREFPEAGQRFILPDGSTSGYRYLLCGKYIMFYKIKNNEVYVSRVFHQKQDYINILFS